MTIEQVLALIAIVATIILASIGLGVAALAVPDHPDRAKAAKVFFFIAAVVFTLAVLMWTILTGRGNFVRVVVDGIWLVFTCGGLIAGFRFADRSLTKATKPETKPQLEGEIQQIVINSRFIAAGSGDNFSRVDVWLRAYIFNSSECQTSLKNFRWYSDFGTTKWAALYAEKDKITQTHIDKHGADHKDREFYNLVDFIRDQKTLTKGDHVDGYLHFVLPCPEGDPALHAFDVSKVMEFGVLIVTDTWGRDHQFRFKQVPLHPSELLKKPILGDDFYDAFRDSMKS